MLAALARAFPDEATGVRWTRPEGGLFLWVMLPAGMNSAALLEDAIAERVAFVPGTPFHPDGSGANTMRLNFSNADEAHIEEGIARLGGVVLRQLSRLGHSLAVV
jgi:DNA-binding transcriptional MocR family regulator